MRIKAEFGSVGDKFPCMHKKDRAYSYNKLQTAR